MGALDDLLARVEVLRREVTGRPVLVGIAGPPGAGKSFTATALERALSVEGATAVVVPMDGFHLANAELERLGLRDRKGAPETFDVHGFVRLLERVHAGPAHTVYAPAFDRAVDAAVAGAVAVEPGTDLVVTEGNYLLHDRDGWERVRPLLDLVAYLDVPDQVRRERLVARHAAGGRPGPAAAAWVDDVDEPNARLVAAGRARADLRLGAE